MAGIREAWAWLKQSVKQLKRSVVALYYAAHDSRTGWVPRIIAAVALAYALSPLDLIPDFIPVLGLLDDLIILPGLIWLAIKLIPAEVWVDAQARADAEPLRLKDNWIAAVCILVVWDALALYLTYVLSCHFGNAFLRAHLWIPLVAVGPAVVLMEAGWMIWSLTRGAAEGHSHVDRDPLLGDPEEGLPPGA